MRSRAIFTIAIALLAASCGTHYKEGGAAAGTAAPPLPAPGTGTPTFSQLTASIFQPRCYQCHSGARTEDGVDLSTYSGVRSQVVAGNPGSSNLYVQVESGAMPQDGERLDENELEAIRAWIMAGALND